jgi:tetratricopeptide (TPR) repeat protein
LKLDPNYAVAWAQLGYLKRTHEWDWKGAEDAVNKALQLEPNNVNVLGVAASLSITSGDSLKAIELFRVVIEKDPLNLAALRALGTSLVRQGRWDEALNIFNKIEGINPGYPGIHNATGRAYLLKGDAVRALERFEQDPREVNRLFNSAIAHFSLGNEEKSRAIMDEYIEKYGDIYFYPLAMMHAWRGENDAAFEMLEKAYQTKTQFLTYILSNSLLLGLHTDPRFPELLEKMGLLEYWKSMPQHAAE